MVTRRRSAEFCFGHDSSVYAKPDRKALRMTATELISPGGRLSELDHIDIASGGERRSARSISIGEASVRTQATDPERRKTPRVRTALPGLRVGPKWLPIRPGYAVLCQNFVERDAFDRSVKSSR